MIIFQSRFSLFLGGLYHYHMEVYGQWGHGISETVFDI